ncbi:RND efflux system, outer membrane lipoprotein CmeC [Sandaracinus amylolyticus]|uniref:RND efflux system, outer membrane lipoprotein CmeC n=2 Tax=Sandaracinus amylolyticus TaxID=927083 RepID=A0A0F6SD70_9BACT|nr:RND efflux system, outer membrane lipoprotein CmeC [Sandaracinus amylolyticus]
MTSHDAGDVLPVPSSPSPRDRSLRATVLALGVSVAAIAAPIDAAAQARVVAEIDDESSDRRRARWSLRAAAARAITGAPRVQAARAQVDAARAHLAHRSVPVVGNPYVSVRALFGMPDQSAATYGVVLGLPFDLSGRQSAWSHEIDQLVEESEEIAEAAANEARAEVASAYVDLAIAQERLAVAEDRLRVAGASHASVRARAEASDATVLDVSLAASELGIARAEVADRRRALLAAQAAFRAALDLDPDVSPEVEPLAGAGPPGDVDLATAITLASERRAEPRAHQAAARRYRLSEDRLFAESIDLLLVGLEWESQGNQRTAHSWGVSATMGLPLIRTAQGERAVARGQSDLELELSVLAERSVEREAAAAWAALQTSLDHLRVIDDEALAAAERALAMSEELLAAGAVDLFRVLNARREVYALRAQRLDALRDAWNARIALERAIGGTWE